jgi:hypothetical protein
MRGNFTLATTYSCKFLFIPLKQLLR